MHGAGQFMSLINVSPMSRVHLIEGRKDVCKYGSIEAPLDIYMGHMKLIMEKVTDSRQTQITGLHYIVQKALHDHSQLCLQHWVKASATSNYITKRYYKKLLSMFLY